ncbi:hypothetical protein ACET3X_002837 [Alternaria dauci]|uniref:Uncharacterized protein n=1 Tax=Alternaria dauci TaxID=48095 RepID=A0ABR3URU7_9PLEO
MADLLDAVRQYSFLEALCSHLRIADFKALSRTSSDFRLCMAGRNKPTIPKHKTLYPFQPVSRPCTCNKNFLADCPKHGPPELRNLLSKVDRTCGDSNHEKNRASSLSMNDNWMSVICDALGGLSNVNSCCKCTGTICFPCWWLRVTAGSVNTRGNGRAQNACSTCWNTDFEKLSTDNPSRAFPATHGHRTWRQAQVQGDFCKCGPAIHCRPCTRELQPPLNYTPAEERFRLDAYRYQYSRPSHKKCIACPTYMSEDGIEKVNHFCPICNLPLQMRNYSHPVDRQSQKLGIYRDDDNDIGREAKVVGPDYESVQEFWKKQWLRTMGLSRPPTNWQPVHFEWERINQASVLTMDERSHFDRCSYFKSIRVPVWDSEMVLFEPFPIRLSGNTWRSIIGRSWDYISGDLPDLYTREEFLVMQFGALAEFARISRQG